jgi:hypothetical protein
VLTRLALPYIRTVSRTTIRSFTRTRPRSRAPRPSAQSRYVACTLAMRCRAPTATSSPLTPY